MKTISGSLSTPKFLSRNKKIELDLSRLTSIRTDKDDYVISDAFDVQWAKLSLSFS